jgi:hypothetical protein
LIAWANTMRARVQLMLRQNGLPYTASHVDQAMRLLLDQVR